MVSQYMLTRKNILRAEGEKESTILVAQGRQEAAILEAKGNREKMVQEALGKAEAIKAVQQANAEGLQMLAQAGVTDEVLRLKAIEAFEKAADGRATKIIIPSEIQGAVGLAQGIVSTVTKEDPDKLPTLPPEARK